MLILKKHQPFNQLLHAHEVCLHPAVVRVYELDGVRGHEDVGEAADDLSDVVLELLGGFPVDVHAVDVVRSVDGAKEQLELPHFPIGCLK